MTLGFSLIRFSTPGQADGDSFRRQLKPAQAFCEKHGLILDTSLHETDVRRLGVSAFKGEQIRKGSLGKFLRLVEAGNVPPGSWLIVEEIDRLTRQIHDQAYDLCLTLMRAGITIATMMDGEVYDLESLNGSLEKRLKLQLRLDAAHEYSKKLRERVSSAWEGRREKLRAGKAPATNACAGWLRAEDGVFHEIPAHVAVMKQIIAWRHLRLGRHAIATMLNTSVPSAVKPFYPDQTRVPNFRGGDGWHPSTIAALVRNIALIGLYQPRKADGTPIGEPLAGHYPRIISDEDFWRAQWGPDNKGSRGHTSKGHWNLLKGICKCGWCGRTLIGLDTGKGKSLICGHSRLGLCGNRYMMTYPPLEADLLAALALFDFARFLDRGNPQVEKIGGLEAAIAEKTGSARRLLKDFKENTPPLVSEQVASLSKEIEGLQGQLAEAKRTARIAEAMELQDALTEFRSMVMSLPGMTEGEERDTLRTRLAVELSRLIYTAIGNGTHLTILLKGIEQCRVDIQFDRSRLTAILLWVSGADEPTIMSRTQLFGDRKNLLGALDQRPRLAGRFAALVRAEIPVAAA
jgi:DNA invertase Pin-like site-specific DNA recombinase